AWCQGRRTGWGGCTGSVPAAAPPPGPLSATRFARGGRGEDQVGWPPLLFLLKGPRQNFTGTNLSLYSAFASGTAGRIPSSLSENRITSIAFGSQAPSAEKPAICAS